MRIIQANPNGQPGPLAFGTIGASQTANSVRPVRPFEINLIARALKAPGKDADKTSFLLIFKQYFPTMGI
jgi:hypothetical protein